MSERDTYCDCEGGSKAVPKTLQLARASALNHTHMLMLAWMAARLAMWGRARIGVFSGGGGIKGWRTNYDPCMNIQEE